MADGVVDIVINYITKGDDKTKAALEDVAKATAAIGTAIAAAKAIYENTVAPTIEYAKQIENLAAVTGTGAEETSKLIQVADDARIEYGTLQVAMKNLVKNGIAPNITNLGNLSDEYLAIKDPVEQSQFAMEMFGTKAGPEMAKLLKIGSDAMNDSAASAEKVGLVMSEQALQAAKDYQASLDNLNDTIEGTKIKLGTAMIPALDDALNGTMAAVDGVLLLREAYISWLNPFDNATKALEEQAAQYYAYQTAVEMTDLDIAKLTDNVNVAGTSFDQYNLAIQNTQTATENYALAQIQAQQETQALFDTINTNLDATITKWLEDLEWMQSGGLALQAQFEAIKKAFIENPQDPDIKAQMEDLFAKTQALKVALGEIDGDAAAQEISDTLGISLSEAYAKLLLLKDDIARGMTLTVTVTYNDPGFTPSLPPGTTPGSGNDLPTPNAAGGVTYAGSYNIVGERGWEPFIPKQDGRILSHEDAMRAITNNKTTNIYMTVNSAQSLGSINQDVGLMRARAEAF